MVNKINLLQYLNIPFVHKEISNTEKPTKLLIYYAYTKAIGHIIEALRYALGYHGANPAWEISFLLNKYSPCELAKLCPWIKNIYTVGIKDENDRIPKNIHRRVPRHWDYIAVIPDYKEREPSWTSYNKCYEQMDSYFNAVRKKGFCGDSSIPYISNQELRLNLPEANVSRTKKILESTNIKIGILPAGCNKKEYFPSIRSWEAIVTSLFEKYGSELSIYFFGAFEKSHSRTISIIDKKGILNLLKKYDNCVNCFDIGLLNQLAVAEKCNIFISPESGFSFAVLAVGTPFLEIAGGPWPQYFHNGVPFYSVLPDMNKYPPLFADRNTVKMVEEEGEKKILSMSYARIVEDIPEILNGADILINKKWNFRECLKYYYSRLKKYYRDPKEIFSFEGIHKQFL